ncbi:MAG: CDP-alcohol phosphatidyltransferase family protein [Clostridia bacterium]|nr:CDP-alcohol phosphatidyltransferase family protein [Clostridia bacterium]
MLKYLNYTVILTFVSLSSALVGIGYSMDVINANRDRPVYFSVICLLICGLCDAFDGRIARRKKDRTLSEIRFGIQLDSLCDIVCFGVLPCCIGYSLGLDRWYHIVVFCFYCICGVIRLCYFNVKEEEELIAEEKAEEKVYTGMPITTITLIFPLFYLLSFVDSLNNVVFNIIYTVVFAICGMLFVVPMKIRKPGFTGILCMIGAGILEAVIVFILLDFFKLI